MDSHFAFIGSLVVGGIFLLSLWGFQADLRDHTFLNTNDLVVQQNALAMTALLEADLRQIGSGIDSGMVVAAGAHAISFQADLDADGTADLVAYSISNPGAASNTPNPADKILYRAVSGTTQAHAAMGVTDFRLRYFDRNGNLTGDLDRIKTIEVTLELESPVRYDGKDAHFFWRKRITPRNLLRS